MMILHSFDGAWDLSLMKILMHAFFYIQGRPQGDLEGPKAPYVKKGKSIKDLVAVVDYVKPTVLLGM